MTKTETQIADVLSILIMMVIHLVIIAIFGALFIFLLQGNYFKKDCEANPPMVSGCKKYNIEELSGCVREGYTGKGFLGLTDWNTVYYVCEDYGRVAMSCIQWNKPSQSNSTRDWENCR